VGISANVVGDMISLSTASNVSPDWIMHFVAQYTEELSSFTQRLTEIFLLLVHMSSPYPRWSCRKNNYRWELSAIPVW